MKLLELYTSVQGEGPNTGVPIQFVRFAGCNMRCAGWPCDTPQAIFPENYKDEYVTASPVEVIDKLQRWPLHVCITGGEPFIQPGMGGLIQSLTLHDYKVDIFTNGSFPFPEQVIENRDVFIIMDWKLIGSGEAMTNRGQRIDNAKRLGTGHSIKFVVKNEDDLYEAKVLTEEVFPKEGIKANLWVGAAWGQIEDAKIVDFVETHQMPWRLNVQQHKYVWHPDEVLR